MTCIARKPLFIAVSNLGQVAWETAGVAVSTAMAASAILLVAIRLVNPYNLQEVTTSDNGR